MAPSFEALTSPPMNGHSNNDTTTKDSFPSKSVVNGKVQTPDSPLPHVSDLDSKAYDSQEALLADIIESLRASGGCVIRNLVNKDVLKEIEMEVRPYLDKAVPWNGEYGRCCYVIL